MNMKLEVGIIGLGEFGLQLAKTLVQLGHHVVGVDESESRVQVAQNDLDTVYRADATQISVLKSLGFQDMDYVVVSAAPSMEQSLSIILNLQEMEVQHIWAKANTEDHRKVLLRLGVEKAILPEFDVATMTAHRLINPGMLDLIPSSGGILLQELVVDKWAGKDLMSLTLPKEYGMMVVAIRAAHEEEYSMVPLASRVLVRGDVLLVVGRKDNFSKLDA